MERNEIKKERILIVEDNIDTLRFLETMLAKEFEVVTAENGVVGMDYARNKSPDLILLDIILPVLNGFDICSLLKKDERTRRIPIIFLSMKTSPADINQGLALGADDYIPKPFDYKELLARVQTRLRISREELETSIMIGDLKIDQNRREVSFGKQKTELTLTEFDILKYLASHAGTVISRDDILKEVWKENSEQANDRTIDVHIRSLRKKLPVLTKHIRSIYGVGYKYEP